MKLFNWLMKWNFHYYPDDMDFIHSSITHWYPVISWSQITRQYYFLCWLTLPKTLTILDINKTKSNNCFIIPWAKKNGSHVLASSLMASNTKCAYLTWLPLLIMHRGHTSHDYLWPWVSLTWLNLYSLQLDEVSGVDFENLLPPFSQSEKR